MKNSIILLICLVLFCSCATIQQQQDVASMKSDVAKLQVKNEAVISKQAELYSKYEANCVAVDTQTAKIEELHKKVAQLSQKVKELEMIIKKEKGDTTALLPSTMYQNAYNDFLVGKYEMAVVGFKSFLKKYPDHDLAAQSQYYIGESLYSKSKWLEAYNEYKTIETNYSNSEFVPAAKLKMALCLEMLNKKEESRLILQNILMQYPNSAEAYTAKEKIKVYTNAKK